VGPSRRRKTRRRKGRIKWGNVCILYGYGANGGTERRDRVLFKRSVFALSKHVIRYCVVCKCCRNQGTCFSCACLLSFNMQTAIPFLQLYARTETPLLNPLSALPLSSPPTSLPLHLSIKRNRRPRRTRRRTISRQIPPPPPNPPEYTSYPTAQQNLVSQTRRVGTRMLPNREGRRFLGWLVCRAFVSVSSLLLLKKRRRTGEGDEPGAA
jgi:hypothetical protein